MERGSTRTAASPAAVLAAGPNGVIANGYTSARLGRQKSRPFFDVPIKGPILGTVHPEVLPATRTCHRPCLFY